MAGGYVVAVFEVDEAEPRDMPDRENLLVRLITARREPLSAQASQGETLAARVVRLRYDLSPSTVFATRGRANLSRKKVAQRLRNRGHSVLGYDEHFRAYVIDLDASGLDDPGRGYVYVGEASQSVDDRFEQHRLGEVSWSKARGSRHFRGRAVRLRPDLTDITIYRSRTASKAAASRLADRLRESGYRVEGGH